MKINTKGFTIIELLVVIAIIGLLSSVVLVSMKGSTGKAKIAKSLEFSQTILNVIGVDAVGIWTFDEGEGDYAYDKSGYGNRGTRHGAQWVEGEENTPHWYVNEGEGRSALSFNGSGDYVNCGSNISLKITEDATWEAWIYPQIAHSGGIICKYYTGEYDICFLGNRKVVLRHGDGATYENIEFTGMTFPLNQWSHFTITRIHATKKATLYVNGIIVDGPKDYTKTVAISDTAVRIGSRTSGSFEKFNGKIDEVRIYASALSSAEIQQHYADGAEKHEIALK